MTAASDRPLCRWCAKPLAKRTHTTWVKRDPFQPTTTIRKTKFTLEGPSEVVETFENKPQSNTLYGLTLRSKADCQRHTNRVVVSVSYWQDTDFNTGEKGERCVHSFNTWDGETYESVAGFFCSTKCAQLMGVAAAKQGKGSLEYVVAIRKRNDAERIRQATEKLPKLREGAA